MPLAPVPLAPFSSIPEHLRHIADYQQQVQLHLPEATLAYLEGGAGQESSLQQNRLQFQEVKLIPRHLNDLTQGHTTIRLFGQDYPHPIFLAPIGHQVLFHPQAEQATALAAALLQSNMILSHFTTTAMINFKDSNPYKWFQLYWQGCREHAAALIQQAEDAGFKALVITIDAAHSGIRDRERQSGFQLPEHLIHPHAKCIQMPTIGPTQSAVFQGLMRLAPTWQDIQWLIQNSRLPVVLKGILHPSDARQAAAIGASGIIVSNHGGRILDTTIAPLDALQMIRKVVPETYPVLIDGGIARGVDVFKAIALGANAVLIGRPYIYGLTTAGALGVAHVLRILKEELEITMALMGTSRIEQINEDCIFH